MFGTLTFTICICLPGSTTGMLDIGSIEHINTVLEAILNQRTVTRLRTFMNVV